jgi:hypothetical protein
MFFGLTDQTGADGYESDDSVRHREEAQGDLRHQRASAAAPEQPPARRHPPEHHGLDPVAARRHAAVRSGGFPASRPALTHRI